MSALLTITEPSGTITAGQSVTYSFSFAGPYPVNWTFSQWGTTKSLTATDNSTASVTLTVPSDPNSFGGTLSFYGTGESASTYYLKPLDGFSEKMYPVINTSDGYAAWSLKKYGNTKFIPNSSTQAFSLSVSAQGRNLALTTGSFPLTVYLTSQQIYPTTGSETTVQTQTYNTLGSYASQTYTTPAVTAGTINRYKLYTTNPSATSFNADTGITLSSCIPISNTQAPFIYVQPVNTTLPVTVLGTQYNATTIGLNYISASSSPTITWFRNGVAVPASWVVTIPNYAGFDTSITVQTSLCTNGDTFYCTITDSNGTVTSSTVTLTINTPSVVDAVTVSAASTASTTMLTGKILTLNAVANANSSVTYQWSKNGASIPGATSASYSTAVTTADSGSSFTVTATSGTATATSSPVTINVYSASRPYPVNNSITWTASASTQGNPSDTFSYSWKFDDGITMVGQSVSKLQGAIGPITGTVTAVDNTTGGSATASRTVSLSNASWVGNTAAARPWYTMTYGNGLFVVFANDNGSGTGAILVSPDGSTWTAKNSPVSANFLGSAYGNGTYVAVGAFAGTNYVVYSTDGTTWTAPTFPNKQWQCVAYGNGVFAALSYLNGITNQAMTSPDGINWTSRNTSSDQQWKSICYGGGKFVALCSGTATMTSVDGITWSTAGSVPNQEWTSVAYGNGIYVAVSDIVTSGQVVWSSDATTWHQVSLPDAIQVKSVAFGNGQFIITPTSSGLNWGSYMTPDCQTFYRIATNVVSGVWFCSVYGTDRFVAMSEASSSLRAQVLLW